MLGTLRRFTLGLLVAGIALTGCDDDDPTSPTLQAPQNVEAVPDGTSVTVTWSAAANASSYRVEVTATGEDDRTEEVSSGTTSVVIDGLTSGVTYTVRVVAIGGGDTAPSQPVEFTAASLDVVTVTGEILEDSTFTSDKVWVISGPVFVGNDIDEAGGVAATLTIEPGTTILGDGDIPSGERGSYLVITRGSQIIADANANQSNPNARPNPEDVIVFTSSEPRGERARQDWGGIVINGRAPTNAGAQAAGEGDSGFFGGTDENDNSGIIRGVRVEFAGDDVTATDQLNGIAFQGVGAGTTVDYVQIHYNEDDGTEPFGGTVSQTHMVMTGIRDDSFDGTDGYRGFIQFGIVQQRNDDGDKAFELSTSSDDPVDATPRSSAVIANVTAVGGVEVPEGTAQHQGLNLREGSNWRVYNTIIAGMERGPVSIDGSTEPFAQNRLDGDTAADDITAFESSILWRNSALSDFDETFVTDAAFNNMILDDDEDLLPGSAFEVGSLDAPPDFIPAAMPDGYTARDVADITDGLVLPTDGRSLQNTSYAGAVEPGTALEDAWYYGWTVWATDGSDSRPNAEGQ